MHDDDRANNNYKHCMEIPRGNSAPITRALAKSMNKMILDRRDKSSRACKVIKNSER